MHMRIFITGATGSIGSIILRDLSRDHSMVALFRGQKGAEMKNVEWVKGDITHVNAFEDAMSGCDALIHLAARLSNSSEGLEEINVHATHALVTKAREKGIEKIIVFSSASVTQKYHTPYAASKEKMENRLRGMGIPLMVLRPTFVYHEHSRSISGMSRYCALPLPFIPLMNDGRANLHPIHSHDVARALRAILSKSFPTHMEAFDLASEESFTLRDAIEMIARKKQINKPIIGIPHDEFFQLYSFLRGLGVKSWTLPIQLAAQGESYRVHPEKFENEYGVRMSNPWKRFWDCI